MDEYRRLRPLRVAYIFSVVMRHVFTVRINRSPLRWLGVCFSSSSTTISEPERLRLLLQDLGGSFLKLGQMLALQTRFLPHDYCKALFDLMDRVPALASEEVESLFVEQWGRGPDEIFDSFDPKPVASASIGQVHVAYLEGQKLAVKIQRPGAAREFKGDLRIMECVVMLIRRLRFKRLDFLIEPLQEFIAWTSAELDYGQEIRTLAALRSGARERSHEYVPAVYQSFSRQRVLAMEFLDGITFLDYLRAIDEGDGTTLRRLEEQGFVVEVYIANLIDNFLHQTFVRGLFHADLHPANLMILPGNVVGYIDLGMAGVLSPYSRRKLMDMTLAYTQGDIEAVGLAFEGLSVADSASAQRFRVGLARLAESWYERSVGELHLRRSISSVMLDMLQLSYETGAWGQRDIIKYIRSAVALDGLIARCAPEVQLGQLLQASCRKCLGEMCWRSNPRSLLIESAAGVRRMLTQGRRASALLERLVEGELAFPQPTPSQPIKRGRLMWRNSKPGVLVLFLLILALKIDDGGLASELLGSHVFALQALLIGSALGWSFAAMDSAFRRGASDSVVRTYPPQTG